MNYGRIISVDCGMTGTGIAIWDGRTWGQPLNPIACVNLYPRATDEWLDKAFSISRAFEETLMEHVPTGWLTYSYFEYPEYFDSALGESVAKTGRLAKLIFNCGMLVQIAKNAGSRVVMFTPHDWKGQLKKDVVNQRIRKILPDIGLIGPKSHSFDAIGIGLYAMGLINQQKKAKERPRAPLGSKTNT